MQLKLYKCLPYLLSYTDGIPDCSNGCANGPWVRIRPSKKDDKGLLAHEVQGHVVQWYMTCGLHSLLYKLSKRYRQWSEVEAYRIQLSLSPPEDHARRIDLYATWLSDPSPVTGYGLTLTKQEALKLLT